MSHSYAAELERVRAAIAAIEGGAQSVAFEGRTVTYADLRALYARVERLEGLAAREGRRGGISISLGAGR